MKRMRPEFHYVIIRINHSLYLLRNYTEKKLEIGTHINILHDVEPTADAYPTNQTVRNASPIISKILESVFWRFLKKNRIKTINLYENSRWWKYDQSD
jgi:hypothetical protein